MRRLLGVGSWQSIWILSVLALLLSPLPFPTSTTMVHAMLSDVDHYLDLVPIFTEDGDSSWKEALRMLEDEEYDAAALHFWRAILLHNNSPNFSVQQAFEKYMQCFIIQKKPADGLAYVALESYRRGQTAMAENYLQQALQMDPSNRYAHAVENFYGEGAIVSPPKKKKRGGAGASDARGGPKHQKRTFDDDIDHGGMQEDSNDDELYAEFTPEQLYEKGSTAFAEKDYELCADVFEISCIRSQFRLSPSCGNAVYCRTSILDWGFNGTDFDKDMDRIAKIVEAETNQHRIESKNSDDKTTWYWRRASSVHPHMMLGFPVKPILKRFVTESVAYMDETMARASDGGIAPLPEDLPYDHSTAERERLLAEFAEPEAKIRVGFVGSGFNSKAVLYLSQDIFRFFDRERFEIHIFSVGPADNPLFIQHGMRGVDWRQRVINNVGESNFHDIQKMKMDHIQMARFIKKQDIHILIEWDGYARQGERAQGLFALRPAPVQILHQEYLGTSGAQYVDYLFSDKITSPPELESLYVEKLIYMPNHFFSKGHAVQAEVKVPTYDYQPKTKPYQLGAGSPQENRCLAPRNVGPSKPSLVFCNFNKFLKNNPETVRSWIRILREVPDSMLCLLENPETGVVYLRKFIHEAAGTSENNKDEDTFLPGDGDDLNNRIHFLPWERNPFDHQQRNHDFCNVMLDSYPYNGHTVAQDSLYGGVPIVSRSDGDDMCSRVTTSANVVLGLSEYLNAYYGPQHYEELAIALGNNQTLFQSIRKQLIHTCLQRNPMHPYWDVPRYVKNFQRGLEIAWDRFLEGKAPDHITIEESEETQRGTYDDELLAHPSDGPLKSGAKQSKGDNAKDEDKSDSERGNRDANDEL